MPDTSYTPAARTAVAATPLRDGPASNVALERAAADDHEHLRDSTLAALEWSESLSVEAAGSATSFTVTVGGISNVTLRNAAGTHYHVKAYGGGTVGASKIEGGGGSLGAVERWWYLYAFLNGSDLDFELSTEGPSTNRKFKNGDFTRRYLGCFPTTSAGAPVALVAQGGRYLYDHDGGALGVYTTNTNVSLATRVPPHAKQATLRATARKITGTGLLDANVADASSVTLLANASQIAWGVRLPGAAVDTAFTGMAEVVPASGSVWVNVGADCELVLVGAGFRE